MKISIYSLTSELHDEQSVSHVTQEFLHSLQLTYDWKGNHYSDYGKTGLDLIYVRTGGTEGIFKKLLPTLQQQSSQPFYLLTSGKSNSLAASMEILSYLIQHHIKGEILHGAPDYITARIQQLFKAVHARKQLQGSRLGIIGQPSDWLISSTVDKDIIRQQLGINLIDIPIEELEETIQSVNGQSSKETSPVASIQRALPDAERIYTALKILVERYRLQGFTLRCFDLLTSIRNTGCLALARLNAEGVVAGCEGDIPAMLSMTIVRSLLGISGFQANPAHINPETGEILFAHCTIPFNMVERYELDTHFESGIGVGIRGYMKEGPVTIFKVSGDLSHSFIAEGELVHNQAKPDLCRTQQVIRLSEKDQVHYFLTHPIGNHHIILPGHQKALLEELLKTQ